MNQQENNRPPLRQQFDVEKFKQQAKDLHLDISQHTGMLTMKTGNQWIEDAKARPIPQMLFSELWHEGEVCILFADTNTGKSILAVQIADSISRGVAIQGFKLQAVAQPVVYLDFELYDKQFEARYSANYAQHYHFSEQMYRVEINTHADIPDEYDTMEDYLCYSLELVIQRSNARVIIVDNITYLRSETERAKDAGPLMKHLQTLKRKYNLSILALAHTPKRDRSKPLTPNDLQGSKMLMNFCDSSFCIGESTNDKSIRYLKQVKARATEHVYHTANVALCRIDKPHNFLQFTHIGYADERQHLLERIEEKNKETLVEECKRLKEEGMTEREIADRTGISKSTVNRYLNS